MTDTGGPAFPVPRDADHGCAGMTLRDYFAAQALLGMIQYYGVRDVEQDTMQAYALADGMLLSRQD